VAFPIESKLVIAIASSALFDLAEADRIFREHGENDYRRYQRQHENEFLKRGVAFPFIRRLLHLNKLFPKESPVEVILLSRNDPDTGLRVFKSIEHYSLPITRAAFVSGRNPFRYMESFNASLFLSGNPADVHDAIAAGLPAGLIFETEYIDDTDEELRIAFDFDGVLADDSAEKVYQAGQLPLFHKSESDHRAEALGEGPLQRFFSEIAKLQQMELKKQELDLSYKPRIRTAIVTARNAPAHERVITTLRHWGIRVDEAFFLGGIDKARVLKEFRPHLFFDDQLAHLESTAGIAPSVHVPFGITNVSAGLGAKDDQAH
jgi:5'-nucleotidase